METVDRERERAISYLKNDTECEAARHCIVHEDKQFCHQRKQIFMTFPMTSNQQLKLLNKWVDCVLHNTLAQVRNGSNTSAM